MTHKAIGSQLPSLLHCAGFTQIRTEVFADGPMKCSEGFIARPLIQPYIDAGDFTEAEAEQLIEACRQQELRGLPLWASTLVISWAVKPL